MRLVIPAAGLGVRWRHYHNQRKAFEAVGFTKHFAEIGGESIIGRLVRLFQDRGVDDIWVVGPDERYALPGTRLFVPTQVPEHFDANKILNSSELWDPDGRTVVFYGDVWLTEEGADVVLAESRSWVAFGRRRQHRWTGASGELFGFAFDAEHHERNRQVLEAIAGMKRRGQLQRCAGWEFFAGFGGNPKHWQGYPELWCDIDDLSDDVDTPEQWVALRSAAEMVTL